MDVCRELRELELHLDVTRPNTAMAMYENISSIEFEDRREVSLYFIVYMGSREYEHIMYVDDDLFRSEHPALNRILRTIDRHDFTHILKRSPYISGTFTSKCIRAAKILGHDISRDVRRQMLYSAINTESIDTINIILTRLDYTDVCIDKYIHPDILMDVHHNIPLVHIPGVLVSSVNDDIFIGLLEVYKDRIDLDYLFKMLRLKKTDGSVRARIYLHKYHGIEKPHVEMPTHTPAMKRPQL